MSSDVQCMALGSVPVGEQRSRFLAIGLSDNTVRVISLDPQDCLQPLSMQALPATPESLCIVEMAMGGLESESGRLGGLFLNIGLSVSSKVASVHLLVKEHSVGRVGGDNEASRNDSFPHLWCRLLGTKAPEKISRYQSPQPC